MTKEFSGRRGRLTLKAGKGGDRGFGFVELEDALPDEEDIHVAGAELGSAMHGDIVLVTSIMRKGRRVGRIENVIERAASVVVGTIDVRAREPVLVTDQATEPIRLTIDPKRVDPGSVRSGLRAVALITTFPTAYLPAKGILTRVLGEAGNPLVELEASKISWNVPREFPLDVVRAAMDLPDHVRPEDLAGRLDLRELATFTIDPTDARDFDDAISIETSGADLKAAYRVGVHIADVSHYVAEGSALDIEAYRRGTSTYLPGSVIPMLPERLSNGLCSLVEGQDRLALTVFFHLDKEFFPVSYSHHRSVIRSHRRFTYDEVDVILDAGRGDFHFEIDLLKKIAVAFNAVRVERGAIDLDLPEHKPILDLNGRILSVKTVERTWSHRLIEELMIHTNEYVARSISKCGIFRIHEPPSPDKMLRLRQMASIVGHTSARGSMQKILLAFKSSPARRVIENLALRTMQEAKYSAKNVGHFGLASDAYSHFTSPIRRYPDLLAHRILCGERPRVSLTAAAIHTSRREREAMEAERDALAIKLLEFAALHLGEKVKGVVDHITREGLYVSLDFGPRGFIPAAELGGEEFGFDRESLSLVGRRTRKRYIMGEEHEVVIASVDIENRRLYLSLAGRPGGDPRRAAAGGARPTRSGRSEKKGGRRKKSGQSGKVPPPFPARHKRRPGKRRR